MITLPLAILQELTSVADKTGVTVDQIIQEAVLDWMQSPARMGNAQMPKDFSTCKHPFTLIDGGQTKSGIDGPTAWNHFGGHLRASSVVCINLPINSQNSLE